MANLLIDKDTQHQKAALGSIEQLISQPKRSSKGFQSSNRPGPLLKRNRLQARSEEELPQM